MKFQQLRECDCGRIIRAGQQRAGKVLRYCRLCDEVMEWTRRDHTTGTTDIQRHQVRCRHTQIRIGSSKTRDSKFHLVDGDGTVCGLSHETRQKDLAVYPPGFKEWCANCLHNPEDPDFLALRETIRHSLRHCQDSDLSPQRYYRKNGYAPTTYVINEWFGGWREAIQALDLVDEHPEVQHAHL